MPTAWHAGRSEHAGPFSHDHYSIHRGPDDALGAIGFPGSRAAAASGAVATSSSDQCGVVYIRARPPSPAARALSGMTKTERPQTTLKPLFPWAARNACTGRYALESKQWIFRS